MALRSLKRMFVVTLQNFVPVLRTGARPFNLTLQFLLHPVRTLFLSSVPHRPIQHKLAFRHYEPMELEGRIVVYSILGCPHCMKAKNTLQELGLPYDDVRLDIFPKSVREEVMQRTGKTSVPQIFFNATHVGGNDDFQKLVQDKEKLNALIEDVQRNPPPPDAPVLPDPSTALESADPGNFVCEPDEYAKLVQELKGSGLVKDHRKGLSVYKNTFCGKEFVDWILQTKGVDREVAVEMGQQLIDRHFGHNVKTPDQEVFRDDQVYYRLLEDDDTAALNGGDISACEPQPASVIGRDLRKMILKLYSAFLSKDGKQVDYKGIGGSTEFQAYVALTKQLQRVKIAEATREEKLAFFINVYNALVIHANIVLGPPVNLWQRYKFFNTVRYIIGGQKYSLQDIENGVLRGNRKGVGQFSRPFSKSDPRLKVALETCEPLIHFGLVCGAKSCPPIKTYTTEEVMEQLMVACQAFLDGPDGCEVDMAKKTAKLSMIFRWYQEDFGKNNEEVAQWVYDHMMDSEKREMLGSLLASRKFKVSHMKYDWSVNSK